MSDTSFFAFFSLKARKIKGFFKFDLHCSKNMLYYVIRINDIETKLH